MSDVSSYRIRRSTLEGEIRLSGAKNSVLRLLAASLLTNDKIVLENFPSKLSDVSIHVGMLEALGKTCEFESEERMSIRESNSLTTTLSWDGRSIRNTLLILGALVTREGVGAVPLPEGCDLGGRPYDLHKLVLETLGCRVWEERGLLCAEAPSEGLVGTDIHLPIRSTGATENAIIAASLARGVTNIWNPHIRPEIVDLVTFLNGMGAHVCIFGQERIEVLGVEELGGCSHAVIADNMEAITWLVASVITGGEIRIQNFPTQDLEVALIHLRESGAEYFLESDALIVKGGKCYPIEISTGPHPGINSDVQPILAAYAAQARGESRIIDLRFPGRYAYASEMAKMGMKHEIDGNLLKIFGNGGGLVGANVRALDLRAGVALVLCGLIAEGETILKDAWQVERGYNNFVSKLQSLGGTIEVN